MEVDKERYHIQRCKNYHGQELGCESIGMHCKIRFKRYANNIFYTKTYDCFDFYVDWVTYVINKDLLEEG